MTRRSKAVRLSDYTGGLNTKSSVTSLELNQALDLQNINILPNGGFESRRGNTTFNSSAMESGAAVHGLGYYRQSDGDDFLVAIAGTKVFKADSLDGTMDDITAALTINTGANNIWNMATLNDILIMVGGPEGSFDAPIKWAGSGDAAALGGTPPSGGGVIVANNRAFIFDITSNRSRIQWSILGNPEDWTGSGSGSQDVSKNDGDTLVAAAVMSMDHMLLFKQSSIHDLSIRTAPFPLFPLFRNVGAVSRRGVVIVDGIVYFITPEPRMKATDGSKIIDFPDTIDDIWDSLNTSRLKYIHGLYYQRLHQIWWFVSTTSATTHDLCLIWDIKRKCWLRHPTGYKMNVSAIAQERTAYCGAYDGKIYKMDVASTYTDASQSSAAINSYWRSGWNDFGSMIEAKTPQYVDLNFVTQSSGSFTLSYGFDFAEDQVTEIVDMTAPGDKWDQFLWDVGSWGGQSDIANMIHMSGKGKFIQWKIQNNSGQPLSFNGMEMAVAVDAPTALV